MSLDITFNLIFASDDFPSIILTRFDLNNFFLRLDAKTGL